MRALLDLLEDQLQPAAASWGDAETMRLTEATRDASLAAAEETFFGERLQQEVQGAQRLLLLDLGGPPMLGMSLLKRLSGVQATYLRIDPNPVSRALTSRALSALPNVESRCLGVDISLAHFTESTWTTLRTQSDLVVALSAGGNLNAVGLEEDDADIRAVVDQLLRHADLCLLSLLTAPRLTQCLVRLRAVAAQGALFDTIRLRELRREEGQLIFGKEKSWPLEKNPPRLPASTGYWSLGVARQDGPTAPLARLFTDDYLRDELLAGFRVELGPIAGEGQLFAARYSH